jgi:hypothetical protein
MFWAIYMCYYVATTGKKLRGVKVEDSEKALHLDGWQDLPGHLCGFLSIVSFFDITARK